MANKVESEPCGGGRRITRLVSTDRDIVVPDSIDGAAVVAIGPFFLSGSPASDGRTVTVPGTVAEIDRDALVAILESAIAFSLDFDLLMPPYEDNKRVTVDQFNTKMDNSKFVTGKRLGYDFDVEDI